MSELNIVPQPETTSKAGSIVRTVLKWSILGLLAFTCIMAAVRKFGG